MWVRALGDDDEEIEPAKVIYLGQDAVVLALIFSSLFSWTPGLKTVSPGLSIVVCTVAAAAICAALFPVKEEREAA